MVHDEASRENNVIRRLVAGEKLDETDGVAKKVRI